MVLIDWIKDPGWRQLISRLLLHIMFKVWRVKQPSVNGMMAYLWRSMSRFYAYRCFTYLNIAYLIGEFFLCRVTCAQNCMTATDHAYVHTAEEIFIFRYFSQPPKCSSKVSRLYKLDHVNVEMKRLTHRVDCIN